MNFDEDMELDRILVEANFTEGGEVDNEPGLLPKLVGAVVTPTVDAGSTQEMAPHERRERVMQTEEGSCQGPSLSFSPGRSARLRCLSLKMKQTSITDYV